MVSDPHDDSAPDRPHVRRIPKPGPEGEPLPVRHAWGRTETEYPAAAGLTKEELGRQIDAAEDHLTDLRGLRDRVGSAQYGIFVSLLAVFLGGMTSLVVAALGMSSVHATPEEWERIRKAFDEAVMMVGWVVVCIGLGASLFFFWLRLCTERRIRRLARRRREYRSAQRSLQE